MKAQFHADYAEIEGKGLVAGNIDLAPALNVGIGFAYAVKTVQRTHPSERGADEACIQKGLPELVARFPEGIFLCGGRAGRLVKESLVELFMFGSIVDVVLVFFVWKDIG